MDYTDRLDSLIVYWAAYYDRDPRQVKRQIRQESNFNPHAVSPAGASGLLQFMSPTWADWSDGRESIYDVEAQIKHGCAYMKALELAFGSLPKALAAYNYGPGNVKKLGADPDWLAKCPRETQGYVEHCLDFEGETVG